MSKLRSKNNSFKYKSLKKFYSCANNLAKEVLNKLPNGTKEQKIEYARLTIEYKIRRSYFEVGNMTEIARKMLDSKVRILMFSIDNMIKNIIAHPEIMFEEYKLMKKIIKKPTKIAKSNNDVILFQNNDKYYMVVVKTTENKLENYVKSFRRLGKKEYDKY